MLGKKGAPLISRGYHILYHDGERNCCPACGKANWIMGRMMAECAFCDTALPLDHVHGVGARPRFIVNGQPLQPVL